MCECVNHGRRRFLQTGVALAVGGLVLRSSHAADLHDYYDKGLPVRELAFMNLHTGESLSTVYWANGDYVAEGLAEINHILRDHRNDMVGTISPHLLDLLYKIQVRFDTTLPFQVFSGYRSPVSNRMLREADPNVAKRSLHMEGMALDFCIEGIELEAIRRVAMELQGGGVGYYPDSHFVHVDIGRVRNW